MNKNEEFESIYGSGLFHRLFKNIYGDRFDKDITVEKEYLDVEQINSYGKITITRGENEIIVYFRDGDWNGSEILDFYIQ